MDIQLRPVDRLHLVIPPKQEKIAKPKQPPKRQPNNKGNLKDFVDLPLDVIFEAVSCLDPQDLLTLARLSQEFRRLFMSRACLSIWRRVLVCAGLPECPKDLSEPQYASLMFDEFCMGCGSTRGSLETEYCLRLRFCKGCRTRNLSVGRKLVKGFPCISDVWPSLPAALNLKFWSNAEHDNAPEPESSDNDQSMVYFAPEVSRMTKLLDSKHHDDAAYPQLVRSSRADATRMMKEGLALYRWAKGQALLKEQETQRVADLRYETIRGEMSALGWEEEYYPPFDIEDGACDEDKELSRNWGKYMRQAKEFCPKEWKKNLPKIAEWYEQAKESLQVERYVAKLCAAYRPFRESHSKDLTQLLPGMGDLSAIPAIHAFCDEKFQTGCTDEELSTFLETFWEHCSDFRSNILSDLLFPLKKATKCSTLSEASLKKASSLFTCTCPVCDIFMIMHKITLRSAEDIADHLITVPIPNNTWEAVHQFLAVSPDVVSAAEHVLLAFGMSKDSRWDDVLPLGKFVCVCNHPDFRGPFSFEDLVLHVVMHRQGDQAISLKRLTQYVDTHSQDKLIKLIRVATSDEIDVKGLPNPLSEFYE